MAAGVIVLGSDERNPGVPLRPIRTAIIGELPSDYVSQGWELNADEQSAPRNASALYLGLGRWHVWLYWRRRPQGYTFRDTQREHIAAGH